MSGVAFVVDEHGRKTAAVIDLRRHRRIWEDFYDILRAESLSDEPRESIESVKRRLNLKKRRNDESVIS